MTAAADVASAANRLTAAWLRECTGREGFVLSGAAVWPLLAALAGASAGDAQQELERSCGLRQSEALLGARTLLEAMDNVDGARGALGVWVREEVPVNPDWVETVDPSLIGRLVGSADEDQAAIDAWVTEKTEGLLEHLPLVGADMLMALVGSLVVQTRWTEPFDDGFMKPDAGPWEGRRISSLWKRHTDLDRVRVAETKVGPVTVLRSPGANDVDVHLILADPDATAGATVTALLAVLAGECATRPGSDLGDDDVAPGLAVSTIATFEEESGPFLLVATPRFEIVGEHDLLALASVFGLESAQDDSRGHFPGISSEPLAVSQAKQLIRAAFDSEGFEAVAATAIGMTAGGIPQHRVRAVCVTFDRPFGFVAVDRRSGLVLVAGWVVEPEPWPPPGETLSLG